MHKKYRYTKTWHAHGPHDNTRALTTFSILSSIRNGSSQTPSHIQKLPAWVMNGVSSLHLPFAPCPFLPTSFTLSAIASYSPFIRISLPLKQQRGIGAMIGGVTRRPCPLEPRVEIRAQNVRILKCHIHEHTPFQ